MSEERLQKILAAAGVGSRRKCEEIIAEGRVTVDGKVVREMGVKVDPARADIRSDGVRIRPERKVYLLLNKPKGCVCTSEDELDRPKVVDLVADRVRERVFAVGRLDEDSEGLIILTNDGEFANLLTHPRYEIRKTYMVVVSGEVSEQTITKISKGVWLAEGRTAPCEVKVIRRVGGDTLLHMTMGEGRNREIRRIFARFDHKVRKLMRINIGGVHDESLKPGRFRPLRPDEVAALRERALRAIGGKAGGPPFDKTSASSVEPLRAAPGKVEGPHVPMREIRREVKKRYEEDEKQERRPPLKGERRREDFDLERRDQHRFRHRR
jgi:23S rRNA pseudouridine2605 synthase